MGKWEKEVIDAVSVNQFKNRLDKFRNYGIGRGD